MLEIAYFIKKQIQSLLILFYFKHLFDFLHKFQFIVFFLKRYNPYFKYTNGLQNYWPFDTNVNDVIGNAHLYDGVNAQLTSDRFGRENSALRLVNGYYKVPSGVYFSGSDFTIMVWLKVRSYGTFSRVIDFGNGQSHAVFFAYAIDSNGRPFYEIFSTYATLSIISTIELGLNKWVHLSSVFQSTSGAILIDGIHYGQVANGFAAGPANVYRTSNYVGRSNWYPSNTDANADFDELKIFNRALGQQEILNEMNNNMFL